MDFETVIAKLRAALTNSKDPVRNQQGWGWKIFKAAEPGPNGSVLYVFVMDPTVKGADYGVAKILAEAYPTEIMELCGCTGCVCHGRTDVDEPAARCRGAGAHQRRARQRLHPAPDTLTPDLILESEVDAGVYPVQPSETAASRAASSRDSRSAPCSGPVSDTFTPPPVLNARFVSWCVVP